MNGPGGAKQQLMYRLYTRMYFYEYHTIDLFPASPKQSIFIIVELSGAAAIKAS